jgi:hypothetical protein
MNIAITGASGFLGRRLTRKLQASGHTVRAVSLRLLPMPDAFAGCDAVVNLAGEKVAQRWSPRSSCAHRIQPRRGNPRLGRRIAGASAESAGKRLRGRLLRIARRGNFGGVRGARESDSSRRSHENGNAKRSRPNNLAHA